jgi:hypothetical protein
MKRLTDLKKRLREAGDLQPGQHNYVDWSAVARAARSVARAAQMESLKRLRKIASLIEEVDNRAAAADGPVTPTRLEMTDREMRQVYALTKGVRKAW